MQLKTGVQIICGFYAIISSLILVSYYATLEKSIIDKYILYFGSKTQYAMHQQQYTNNPTNPNYDKPDTKLIEVSIFHNIYNWIRHYYNITNGTDISDWFISTITFLILTESDSCEHYYRNSNKYIRSSWMLCHTLETRSSAYSMASLLWCWYSSCYC